MKTGFTLIELLVVVLIIGILSSVALPKYQVAVAKSRLAALMPTVKTMKDSMETYYLANGSYPGDSMEMLDIELPGCTAIGAGICKKDNQVYDVLSHGNSSAWQDVAGYTIHDTSLVNSYHLFLDHSDKPGQKYCGAATDNNIANAVCKSLGGILVKTEKCTVSWHLNAPTCKLYLLP